MYISISVVFIRILRPTKPQIIIQQQHTHNKNKNKNKNKKKTKKRTTNKQHNNNLFLYLHEHNICGEERRREEEGMKDEGMNAGRKVRRKVRTKEEERRRKTIRLNILPIPSRAGPCRPVILLINDRFMYLIHYIIQT